MNRAERRQQSKHRRKGGHAQLPPEVHRLFLEAVGHHQAKRFAEAEQRYASILEQFPNHPDTLHLRGLLAYQQGDSPLALSLIAQAIAGDSSKPHYFFNQALAFEKVQRWEEAITAYGEAIRINPHYVEAHNNLGNVYRQQRRWAQAMACYQHAQSLKPDSADLSNNLGVVCREQGDLETALTHYEKAVSLNPRHAEAHHNMGVALQHQGQLEQAAESFNRALAVKPGYAHAHYHLGLNHLWREDLEQAMACFQRSAVLTYHHQQGVAPAFVTKARIKHDDEQIQYLLSKGYERSWSLEYEETLPTVSRRMTEENPESIFVHLTPEEQVNLAPSFNQFVFLQSAERMSSPAINPALDVEAIEAQYFSTNPEAMYVDHLLTPQALDTLRTFCLASTIWKRDYQNGYIGTFIANGFACPLLLQISEELRTKFPRIFQDHKLVQSWAFKHDSAMQGLNMHADAAAVNVNFWITPDEANRNQDSGGLVVWDKEAPDDWDFVEYNDDKNQHKIHQFLQDSGARPITIPHRQNRAIIFNSNLFHETDTIEFHDTYESRRINVTLLYGHRQKARRG